MMKPDELQRHITSAYFSLRLGIVVASIALPIFLYFGGLFRGSEPLLLASISDYYHSPDHLLRDWFVGTLCVVGVFLYSYKGFSTKENIALNLAGLFAVLTAINPCICDNQPTGTWIHGTSAVLFYVFMAFVCLWCAPETLELSEDPAFKKKFARRYRIIGWLLVLSPAAAVGASFALRLNDQRKFFIETFGLVVFASYWAVKSREMSMTQGEIQAAAGQAAQVKGGVVRKDKVAAYR